MKTMIPALMLATALASIQPADACHRFHTWRYPWAQRCGFSHENRNTPATITLSPSPENRSWATDIGTWSRDDDRSWYVEITKEPTLEDEKRTPAEIFDFDEHYIALDQHKDEINNKMIILHAEEDAARAAGIGQ